MIKSILIVGFGSIGKRHARLARNLFPHSKIIILRHKISKKIKYQYIDHCVTNLIDAIKFKPQIAIIANPATHHIKIAYPLAKLGIHLLIEKPISNSSKNILNLIKMCNSKKNYFNGWIQPTFHEVFNKISRNIKKKCHWKDFVY